MRNMHIDYGGTKALNGVDFDLKHGEIHALIGEHRAGKSSLVKILSGAEKRKEGRILFDGRPLNKITPISATKAGIGIVYQNSAFIPDLNAVENIFTGLMIQKPFFTLNHRVMLEKTEEIFRRIDFDIDLQAPLHRLSAVEQHMVEFARALMIQPRILILDELSNKLTPEEMKKIYRIIFELKTQGNSVIYISHDMDEVLKLADRVTILKNGYRRETTSVKNLDNFRLLQLTYSFSIKQQRREYTETRFDLLKKYLETIIQNFPIGVILLDTKKICRLINFAALHILGDKHSTAIDRPFVHLLANIPPSIMEEISTALESEESRSWEEVGIEGKKLIRFDLFPLRDEESKLIGSTVILQDVSMDKYLPEYLLQSEKMASVAEVAVGVAHEINNPLFIIQNYVELIKTRATDSDVQEKVSKIETELERIVEIVTSLLSFSRMKAPLERRVDLKETLDDIFLLLNHVFAEKRISVAKEYTTQAICVAGDENKLKQLFMNLIGNSIEAVLDNGVVALRVSKNDEQGYAEIAISDNGSGIPDDVADKIFAPFFSTKISKKNTGLGLSICRHIVEEHKGTIKFESVPGESTTFTVRLPLAENDLP
ncbi:MAG: ATP-binding protein [Treponemataceae bacterium]